MAPEIHQKVVYFGGPADIWALGVILFKMLCGTFPFDLKKRNELD